MSYPKLRGRIREMFGTQEAFATAMGMDPSTLSCKLTGRTEWTWAEIERACTQLTVPLEDAHLYFFCGES
jgi:DNA transposition AAA+ family ATPase